MPDFGWSLPPGCTALPGEEEPCERGLVYLTAKTARADELAECASDLEGVGFVMATNWFRGVADRVRGDDLDVMLAAQREWDALHGIEVFVLFTEAEGDEPGKGGRHVLFGAAYALGKRCVVVGRREHLFHWLPDVQAYESWSDALDAIVATSSPAPDADLPADDEYDPFGDEA